MLAPLKDRSVLEKEPPDYVVDAALPDLLEQACLRVAQLEAEKIALKLALRDLRQIQRRRTATTTEAARRQAAELVRLQRLCHDYRKQLDDHESGRAIVALGRRLMELNEQNARLRDTTRHMWLLDKTVCDAHRECERLAQERDRLATRLCQLGEAGVN